MSGWAGKNPGGNSGKTDTPIKMNGLAAIRTRVSGFEARQDILATPRVHGYDSGFYSLAAY